MKPHFAPNNGLVSLVASILLMLVGLTGGSLFIVLRSCVSASLR